MKPAGLLLLLLAALLAVAACASKADPEPAAPPPVSESGDVSEPNAPRDPTDPAAIGGDGAERTGEAAEGADASDEAEPPAEPDYYMNKNYIIVPKAEGAEKKVALLTFDDGPKDEQVLGRILETLEKHEAKAIFFVNGYRVKQHPELLKRIAREGHAVGNHSWDHIDLKKQTEETVDRQIGDVQKIVEDLTGERPVFFRPPYGSASDYVKAKAAEEGLLFMTWSNGSRDWIKEFQTPEKIVASVLEQLHPGSNILLHELPWTAEALDGLLTALEERGYRFLDPRRIDPHYSKN